MNGIMKTGIGLVGVALVIGVVSLVHPLPIAWGWTGFAFLATGTVVGLSSLFARNGHCQEEKRVRKEEQTK